MTASLSECMQGRIEVIQEKVVPEVSKANVSVLINKKWGDPIQPSLEDSRKRKINLSEKKRSIHPSLCCCHSTKPHRLISKFFLSVSNHTMNARKQ